MSAIGALSLPRVPRGALLAAGVLLAVLVATGSGLAAMGESLHALVLCAVVAVAGLLLFGLAYPRAAYALLVPNVIIFPALPVFEGRGANPLDVLMPIVLLSTWVFIARRRPAGALDAELLACRRDFARAGTAYYLVALLSLGLLALRGMPAEALDSLIVLCRSMQAAVFYFLVREHARDAAGVRLTRNAIFAGLAISALINLPAVALLGVPRAGAVLVIGAPGARAAASWSIGGSTVVMTNPNEAAAACLLIWALLIAVPPRRPWRALGLVASFLLLVATQSRSGLLGWVAFNLVLGLRPGHRKLLLLPVLAAVAVPLLPDLLRNRLLRTLVMEEGSFEAYTSLIRVFCWQAAVGIFLDHPILGVGFLGLRHVAQNYNPLGVYLFTAESFFLETASGMGLVGLAALAWIGRAAWRLGRAASLRGEPGSPAARLGGVATPYLVGVAVTNLTGDNLVGLLCASQFILFFTLLAQAALVPELRRAPGSAP